MDLSGGFLKLGSVGKPGNVGNDTSKWDQEFVVTHNVAHTQALEYSGTPAFFGGWIAHAEISHNTVSDAAYTAFSQGWGWSAPAYTHPGYGNVTLSCNKIFAVMKKMKDGGGIYLNGHTSGNYTNLVTRNWVNNDDNVFAVYYLDAGASHWHLTENVATNSSTAYAFLMNGGNGPCISDFAANNTIDHLWCQGDASPSNLCKQCGCVVDGSTVFSVPAGQALPAEARAIMAAAGAKVGE